MAAFPPAQFADSSLTISFRTDVRYFHQVNCNCGGTGTEIDVYFGPPTPVFDLATDRRFPRKGWLAAWAARKAAQPTAPVVRHTAHSSPQQAAGWREYARRRMATKLDRAPPILACAA